MGNNQEALSESDDSSYLRDRPGYQAGPAFPVKHTADGCRCGTHSDSRTSEAGGQQATDSLEHQGGPDSQAGRADRGCHPAPETPGEGERREAMP